MMKMWKYILMSVLALGILSSCSDDEDNFAYGDFLYELVTYMGSQDGRAMFTYQSYNDSPLITLTASNVKEVNAPVGQRMLLNYEVDESLSESNHFITVKGLSKVNTDTIVFVSFDKLETLKKEPVKIASVWRSGNYLNVRCSLQYSEEARVMGLATTGDIDADGVLKCYQIQDTKGAQLYYWTETYFSYYIAPATNLNDCKTLRYYVNDELRPNVKWYDFELGMNDESDFVTNK